MIKRLMYVALAFAMTLGLFGQVDEANAKKKIGKCTIVIDANENYYKTGNLATPKGDEGCEDLKNYGYYGKYQEEGFFIGARKVKNNEVIEVIGPSGFKYDEYKIEVITNKPQSDQNQGSQQSQSTSNQTSQPKQNNTTQSNQTSQPKQNNTTQSKQTSQPKQNNTTVKQTTNQVAQNTQKEETKTLQAKGDEQEKNKKENDKDKKDEKLSVDELKDKNAKVVKENGKFYASYKDEKGKDVKQEITEEEAKELGFVEKVEKEEIEKEEIEKEEPEKVEAKEKEDKKSSKAGIIAGVTTAALAGLGGAGYFIFRRFI